MEEWPYALMSETIKQSQLEKGRIYSDFILAKIALMGQKRRKDPTSFKDKDEQELLFLRKLSDEIKNGEYKNVENFLNNRKENRSNEGVGLKTIYNSQNSPSGSEAKANLNFTKAPESHRLPPAILVPDTNHQGYDYAREFQKLKEELGLTVSSHFGSRKDFRNPRFRSAFNSQESQPPTQRSPESHRRPPASLAPDTNHQGYDYANEFQKLKEELGLTASSHVGSRKDFRDLGFSRSQPPTQRSPQSRRRPPASLSSYYEYTLQGSLTWRRGSPPNEDEIPNPTSSAKGPLNNSGIVGNKEHREPTARSDIRNCIYSTPLSRSQLLQNINSTHSVYAIFFNSSSQICYYPPSYFETGENYYRPKDCPPVNSPESHQSPPTSLPTYPNYRQVYTTESYTNQLLSLSPGKPRIYSSIDRLRDEYFKLSSKNTLQDEHDEHMEMSARKQQINEIFAEFERTRKLKDIIYKKSTEQYRAPSSDISPRSSQTKQLAHRVSSIVIC
jgi:hypothetical protein